MPDLPLLVALLSSVSEVPEQRVCQVLGHGEYPERLDPAIVLKLSSLSVNRQGRFLTNKLKKNETQSPVTAALVWMTGEMMVAISPEIPALPLAYR